jgi:hypothetical protein
MQGRAAGAAAPAYERTQPVLAQGAEVHVRVGGDFTLERRGLLEACARGVRRFRGSPQPLPRALRRGPCRERRGAVGGQAGGAGGPASWRCGHLLLLSGGLGINPIFSM